MVLTLFLLGTYIQQLTSLILNSIIEGGLWLCELFISPNLPRVYSALRTLNTTIIIVDAWAGRGFSFFFARVFIFHRRKTPLN